MTTTSASAPIFVCDNVSKHYGSLAAVDGMSLAIDRGTVLGIGGPNGAGKTTFFDVVTGVTPATGGRAWFGDTEITGFSSDRICQLGVARTFQLNATFDSLTVRENVEVSALFGREARRLPRLTRTKVLEQAASEALDFVGLADKADQPAARLPVLDRKLLMIAGAVATDPQLLFLDEPVGGLAVHEIDRVMEIVEKIRARGVTIVLIEHVMRFLLALSTKVVIMHQGKILFEGQPSRVADDERVVNAYLGAGASSRLKRYFAAREA
ncbi:ABC transporter ATP-binding protein [Pseudoxanthobacter sp.]|uniref:ABC transporter ATP-binding protein n=1 Tax=Pseudoxanthobacter sp. TaxID=1925742 RepID=UPI002FE1A74B